MVAKALERPTLVLNRNWQPVNVATVSRALVLLWNESARVVDPADYRLYTWADWSELRPRDGEQFIQAVRLPPGKHRVRLQYRSRFLIPGLAVSLLAILLPAGLAYRRQSVLKSATQD